MSNESCPGSWPDDLRFGSFLLWKLFSWWLIKPVQESSWRASVKGLSSWFLTIMMMGQHRMTRLLWQWVICSANFHWTKLLGHSLSWYWVFTTTCCVRQQVISSIIVTGSLKVPQKIFHNFLLLPWIYARLVALESKFNVLSLVGLDLKKMGYYNISLWGSFITK